MQSIVDIKGLINISRQECVNVKYINLYLHKTDLELMPSTQILINKLSHVIAASNNLSAINLSNTNISEEHLLQIITLLQIHHANKNISLLILNTPSISNGFIEQQLKTIRNLNISHNYNRCNITNLYNTNIVDLQFAYTWTTLEIRFFVNMAKVCKQQDRSASHFAFNVHSMQSCIIIMSECNNPIILLKYTKIPRHITDYNEKYSVDQKKNIAIVFVPIEDTKLNTLSLKPYIIKAVNFNMIEKNLQARTSDRLITEHQYSHMFGQRSFLLSLNTDPRIQMFATEYKNGAIAHTALKSQQIDFKTMIIKCISLLFSIISLNSKGLMHINAKLKNIIFTNQNTIQFINIADSPIIFEQTNILYTADNFNKNDGEILKKSLQKMLQNTSNYVLNISNNLLKCIALIYANQLNNESRLYTNPIIILNEFKTQENVLYALAFANNVSSLIIELMRQINLTKTAKEFINNLRLKPSTNYIKYKLNLAYMKRKYVLLHDNNKLRLELIRQTQLINTCFIKNCTLDIQLNILIQLQSIIDCVTMLNLTNSVPQIIDTNILLEELSLVLNQDNINNTTYVAKLYQNYIYKTAQQYMELLPNNTVKNNSSFKLS